MYGNLSGGCVFKKLLNMDENNGAQDTLESDGGQVETKKLNKKKWKIPRVSSGPMCLSMYEWALRLSLIDMVIYFAHIFFKFKYTNTYIIIDNGRTDGISIFLVGRKS